MRYVDPNTQASDPGGIELDKGKLKLLMPELFDPFEKIMYLLRHWEYAEYIAMISDHIKYGDSQGAIVVSTSPLLIAAYNEDIDCVVMLKYEDYIQDHYQFKIKERLLCVNTFGREPEYQKDLIPGKNDLGMWKEVHPIIAELVSSDDATIQRRKDAIGDEGYAYIWNLATAYLELKKGVFRDGRPLYAAEESI